MTIENAYISILAMMCHDEFEMTQHWVVLSVLMESLFDQMMI